MGGVEHTPVRAWLARVLKKISSSRAHKGLEASAVCKYEGTRVCYSKGHVGGGSSDTLFQGEMKVDHEGTNGWFSSGARACRFRGSTKCTKICVAPRFCLTAGGRMLQGATLSSQEPNFPSGRACCFEGC